MNELSNIRHSPCPERKYSLVGDIDRIKCMKQVSNRMKRQLRRDSWRRGYYLSDAFQVHPGLNASHMVPHLVLQLPYGAGIIFSLTTEASRVQRG